MSETKAPDGGGSDPRTRAIRLLILRALYEGDVIEYPVPPDARNRPVFDALEAEDLIIRWDRMWPLHDRYRLTVRGVALMQNLHDPESEQLFAELRAQDLAPSDRRQFFRSRNRDPYDYSVVNDPYASWETWDEDPGPYYTYVSVTDQTTPEPAPLPDDSLSQPLPAGVLDLDRDAGTAHGIHNVDVSDVS